MPDLEVAKQDAPEVASSDDESSAKGVHQDIMTSSDAVVLGLTTRKGNRIAEMYILGTDDESGRITIGVHLEDKSRVISAVVFGPMQQMTSEHVRRTGRSPASFPGSDYATIEVFPEGHPDAP